MAVAGNRVGNAGMPMSRRGFVGTVALSLAGAACVPGIALADNADGPSSGLLATIGAQDADQAAPEAEAQGAAEGTFDELKVVDPITIGTVVQIVDDSRLASEGVLTVRVDNSGCGDTFASFVVSVRVADADRFALGDFECPIIERGSEFLFEGQTLERDIQVEWGEGAETYEIMSVTAEIPSYGLLPFETIEFGQYPQGAGGELAPIQWYVIERREDGSRLLLSKYVLDRHDFFDDASAHPTWEDSAMRAWLNGEFLDAAFDEGELARIAESKNAPSANVMYGTDSGYGTIDRVFLLGLEDLLSVFSVPESVFDGSAEIAIDYEQLVSAPATEYAAAQGVDTYTRSDILFGAWVLRTPGAEADVPMNITSTGSLWLDGTTLGDQCGARPVIVLLP